MSKRAKILVVCSNYYPDLAKQYLQGCRPLLEQSPYDYAVETLDAGTYEVPFAIQYFNRNHPYDAYLPLSLLLKGTTDHYEFILRHVQECFIRFAMEGIVIGNGIISAPSMEALTERVENLSRADEALKAIDYLLGLKQRYTSL